MANTIRVKRSAVDGRAPTIADLELGELAINTYMGKIYLERNRNGVEDVVLVGVPITIGTTAPPNPEVGDLWVDTN